MMAIIPWLVNLFGGAAGKWIGIGLGVAGAALLIWAAVARHDNNIRRQDADATNAATAATERADANRAILSVEDDAAKTAARARLLSDQRDEVTHAPDADKPVTDAAVLRALCLLDGACPNDSNPPPDPAKPAVMRPHAAGQH